MHPTLRTPMRTLSRCLVCGFTEVQTDEVIDRGLVLLHECPRCEHRWTQASERPLLSAGVGPRGVVPARPTRRDRELPDAA